MPVTLAYIHLKKNYPRKKLLIPTLANIMVCKRSMCLIDALNKQEYAYF